MHGTVGILNVGCGDTKITFDPENEQDRIRAARIVKDMLRRGYALLIEEPPGSKKYRRAYDFDEARCEYVIADLDPAQAAKADKEQERTDEGAEQKAEAAAGREGKGRKRGGYRTKRVAASSTNAVAVARSAGG